MGPLLTSLCSSHGGPELHHPANGGAKKSNGTSHGVSMDHARSVGRVVRVAVFPRGRKLTWEVSYLSLPHKHIRKKPFQSR